MTEEERHWGTWESGIGRVMEMKRESQEMRKGRQNVRRKRKEWVLVLRCKWARARGERGGWVTALWWIVVWITAYALFTPTLTHCALTAVHRSLCKHTVSLIFRGQGQDFREPQSFGPFISLSLSSLFLCSPFITSLIIYSMLILEH